jgi:TonB-linked SusC/RagA family outer membrane protein
MIYDQGSLMKYVAGDNRPIDYKTYSVDLRLDHIWRNSGVKLGLDVRPFVTDNKNYSNSNLWRNIQAMSPLDKVYNTDGSYAPNSPMAAYADTTGSYTKKFNFGVDVRLNLDWDIKWVKGLQATFWGSYQLGADNTKTWTREVPTYNEDGSMVDTSDPSLYMYKAYNWVYEYNVGVKYANTFNDHSISAGLFYNQREYYNESINAQRINYFDNIDQIFAGPADGQTNGGTASEGGRLGLVGTLSYDYANRYMLTGSFRYDGNDGFAKGHRWGFFPSVAAGYMISNEPYMQSLKEKLHMEMLKLRASIGQIGETSSRFAYLSNWSVDQTAAYIGGALVPVVWPAQLTTTDLSWYTTTTWNIGADFAFLNNRLTATADYFFRRTKGYLINPIDRYNSTLGNQTGRNGNTYTYGLPKVKSDDAFRRAGAEFSINWQDKIGDWSYSIGANLTFYDQLWEKYDQGDDAVTLANPNQRTTHVTLGQGGLVYLYDGLFRTSQELLNSPVQTAGTSMMAGDARYIDVNGDGQITSEDMVYDNKPRQSIMQWGIPFSVKYKEWSLSGLLQGTGPQYGMLHNNLRGTGWNKIYYTDQLDYYYPGNEDAKYPRADNDYGVWNGEMNRANSSLWRINKTYARLKNLSISYDLKYRLLKNCKFFTNASIALTATNLFTICPSLKYADPETGPINDTSTVQTSSYPVTRTFSVSVNLGF